MSENRPAYHTDYENAGWRKWPKRPDPKLYMTLAAEAKRKPNTWAYRIVPDGTCVAVLDPNVPDAETRPLWSRMIRLSRRDGDRKKLESLWETLKRVWLLEELAEGEACRKKGVEVTRIDGTPQELVVRELGIGEIVE